MMDTQDAMGYERRKQIFTYKEKDIEGKERKKAIKENLAVCKSIEVNYGKPEIIVEEFKKTNRIDETNKSDFKQNQGTSMLENTSADFQEEDVNKIIEQEMQKRKMLNHVYLSQRKLILQKIRRDLKIEKSENRKS
eukprot:TRINITY_DN30487_c0_g1_i1.p1 TRINITY_DN30487_c0_g1~~TRINITY_DN30487_c0_g1_i1.p1  ORF type:complete len:158 (-),score=44.19 TRINITY_DN30487_c0_g1_i1:27-434(-)